MPTGVGLNYNNVFKNTSTGNNNMLYGGELEPVTVTANNDNTGGNSGSGNNVMNSIFSNLGGWLSGAGNLINSIKGNPVQNPNEYYPTTPPPQRNNMWIWIVAGVLVLSVAGFFLMKKK